MTGSPHGAMLSGAKSNHTTLGHSRGKLCDHCGCSLSGPEHGNCCRYLRRVVEFGQRRLPWSIAAQMLFHVPDQMPPPFTGMVTSTFVVDIAKGPFDGIGLGAVGGQLQQLKARMGGQPLLDFLGLVQFGVVDDYGEGRKEGRRVRPIERVEQF